MSPKIEWIPAYSVGREDIDSQHQYLFQLIDAIADERADKELNKCVMKFFKYTREHFLEEERILAAIDYPQLQEHQKLHEELITQLTEIGEKGFSDEKALLEFKEFAYNWITDHILQQDHQYLRYVRENNLNW